MRIIVSLLLTVLLAVPGLAQQVDRIRMGIGGTTKKILFRIGEPFTIHGFIHNTHLFGK
ncbi:MAG: hypothetical protein O2797_07870 [Bacteroidetes bacterium]|nr:hypothetical protein [Bacteroidota bacterium]MDA1334123.1 hypothetical protein [Bacteroidota bacterium]